MYNRSGPGPYVDHWSIGLPGSVMHANGANSESSGKVRYYKWFGDAQHYKGQCIFVYLRMPSMHRIFLLIHALGFCKSILGRALRSSFLCTLGRSLSVFLFSVMMPRMAALAKFESMRLLQYEGPFMNWIPQKRALYVRTRPNVKALAVCFALQRSLLLYLGHSIITE